MIYHQIEHITQSYIAAHSKHETFSIIDTVRNLMEKCLRLSAIVNPRCTCAKCDRVRGNQAFGH